MIPSCPDTFSPTDDNHVAKSLEAALRSSLSSPNWPSFTMTRPSCCTVCTVFFASALTAHAALLSVFVAPIIWRDLGDLGSGRSVAVLTPLVAWCWAACAWAPPKALARAVVLLEGLAWLALYFAGCMYKVQKDPDSGIVFVASAPAIFVVLMYTVGRLKLLDPPIPHGSNKVEQEPQSWTLEPYTGEEVCVICLEGSENDNVVLLYTHAGCIQPVHRCCVDEWVGKNRKCLVCRGPVKTEPDAPPAPTAAVPAPAPAPAALPDA